MIKAVIFDCDGLMFDTESVVKENFYKLNKKFKIKLDEFYRISCIGKSEALVREEMKKQFPDFAVDKYRDALIAEQEKRILKGNIRAMDGLYELLDYLTSHHYKLAMISGSPIKRIHLLLTSHGIDPKIFTVIVDGDSEIKPKPYPDAFIYCAKKMRVKTSECVMLEDAFNGIYGAIKAGCKAVMIPDTAPPTEEIKSIATILNNLTEVISYLENQNR